MTKIVYKFLPLDRLSYIENELLRITQPSDLNDPFELIPAIPTTEEFISVLEKNHKESIVLIQNANIDKSKKKELLQSQLSKYKIEVRKLNNNEEGNFKSFFLESAYKNINTHLGILSLTRRWDSNLMWAHYTNSHKGICIGFDSSDPFFSSYRQIADVEKIFMPVAYEENRIKIPLEKGIKIDFKVVLSKSKDWEYEQEERLLVMLRNSDKVIPNKPFDIHLYKIPHNLVKEIIIGANFPLEMISTVKDFCTKNNIELYKSKISETKYDMEREKYSH
jgi:hypothetical protein